MSFLSNCIAFIFQSRISSKEPAVPLNVCCLPFIALRKTMLHAHRQAWCWQDEWCDLKMEDIRQLEQEAARELQEKMAAAHMDEEMMLSKNGDLHESLKAVELRNDSQNENRLASSRMDSLTSDYTADGSVFSMDSPSNSFRESRRRLSQRLSSDSKGWSSSLHILPFFSLFFSLFFFPFFFPFFPLYLFLFFPSNMVLLDVYQ